MMVCVQFVEKLCHTAEIKSPPVNYYAYSTAMCNISMSLLRCIVLYCIAIVSVVIWLHLYTMVASITKPLHHSVCIQNSVLYRVTM